MIDAVAIARRIAALGLKEGSPIFVPNELWPELLGHITFEHLTGLAVAMLESGQLVISAAQEEELLTRQRDAMVLALANERNLLNVGEAFERERIEFIVLKGPAVARTFYPDAAWRPFVDIDLLVRARDWNRACAVLAALGLERRLPEPRRNFDVRFGKAAEYKGKDGLDVDLHRTLVLGPFGLWLNPDELFERTASFELAGWSFARLDDTAALLHACMHAALGAWPIQLLPLRDVGQVALHGRVDWLQIADWGTRWRADTVLKLAFDAAHVLLRLDMPDEARALIRIEPTASSARVLDAYVTDWRERGGPAVSTLLAIPGVAGKVAYVASIVVPRREFLAAREQAHRSTYLHRWTVPVRWLSAVFSAKNHTESRR